MHASPVEVRAAAVNGVFPAYRELKEDDRQRVNLALERMIRSRCQFVSGNRAIALAIALEVLFMNADRSLDDKLAVLGVRRQGVPKRKTKHQGKCVHCLQDPVELTWDHVLPVSWYPTTTPPNLEKWQIPSCWPCN
jgi:hypothetical protein